MTASDLAVRTTAAGGFPASHRAGCPTKPNASAPSTGCDNDGDVGVDEAGAAGDATSREEPLPNAKMPAMTAAAIKLTTVIPPSRTGTRPGRRGGAVLRAGAGGYGL